MPYHGGGGGGDSAVGIDNVYNGLGALAALVPVYRTGAETDSLPEIGLSNAGGVGADQKPRQVSGLTKEAATAVGAIEIICRGPIENVNTDAYTAGQELWLDTTSGQLVTSRPLLDNSQVRVGFVLVKHATEGIFIVEIEDLSWVGSLQASIQANERTGFSLDHGKAVDLGGNDLDLTVDAGTRTFSIVPTSPTFAFFSLNNLFVKTGTQSVVWDNTEGLHFIYYDEVGVLQTSDTFDPRFILGPWVFVGAVQWDFDNQEVILDGPFIELHGEQMDGATHYHLHQTLGTQWYSGLALNSLVTGGTGNLDSDAQFGADNGQIADEDIWEDTAAYASTAGLRILFLDGAAGDLRQTTKAGFSILTDVDTGVGATGRLVYNYYTGATWTTAAIGNNNFVLCHVFAAGIMNGETVYAFLGQNEYSTIDAARAGADTEIGSIVTVLPFKEIRPIGTVILQSGNAFANSVKARAQASADGDYVDFRQDAVPGGAGFTPSDHNSLAGRSDLAAHPATSVTVDPTLFDNNLDGTVTTVQLLGAAVDELFESTFTEVAGGIQVVSGKNILMPNNGDIRHRNAADTSDREILTMNASNQCLVGRQAEAGTLFYHNATQVFGTTSALSLQMADSATITAADGTISLDDDVEITSTNTFSLGGVPVDDILKSTDAASSADDKLATAGYVNARQLAQGSNVLGTDSDTGTNTLEVSSISADRVIVSGNVKGPVSGSPGRLHVFINGQETPSDYHTQRQTVSDETPSDAEYASSFLIVAQEGSRWCAFDLDIRANSDGKPLIIMSGSASDSDTNTESGVRAIQYVGSTSITEITSIKIVSSDSATTVTTGVNFQEGNICVTDPTLAASTFASIKMLEQSADPTEPADGESIIWTSDGTGKGDLGDILAASNQGGTTKYGTLFDYSAGTAW